MVLLLSWTKTLLYLYRKYCFKLKTKVYNFLLFGNSLFVQFDNASSWWQRFWKARFWCNHINTHRCIFKCLRFRKRRSPFSIVAVWSRGENVSKTMRLQTKLVWLKLKISLHYLYKISCLVMRMKQMIIHCNLSKVKNKIRPTCLQGNYSDSLGEFSSTSYMYGVTSVHTIKC